MITAEDLQTQRNALLNGCAFVPISRTRIEATGSDRASFLHNFCTNDVKQLQPGAGCEAFITSVQGKTIGHGYLLADEERITLDSVAGQGELLYAHLDRYLITEDVELADSSSQFQTLLVGGAKLRELAESIRLPLPDDFCGHAIALVAAKQIGIARTNITSDSAFQITVRTEDAPLIVEALVAEGAMECSIEAMTLARVENGVPEFGLDITDVNLPQEVDRNDSAISFTKGCYLGQETVARLDALGHVNRVLRRISIQVTPDTPGPKTGDEIVVDDKKIGWFGTVANTPDAHVLAALAYVKVQHADVGTTMQSSSGLLTVR